MATLTLSYDDTQSRTLLSATALSPSATVALFESSLDQIHWTQVRGGAAVPVVSLAASVYDYEFSPGVLNYYRVSAINTGAPSFVGSSAAVTAVGVAVTPTLPTYLEGDLLVIWCAIRNSGTGTVVCPTNYTVMYQTDNIGLFGRRAGVGGTEIAPTVNVTGGVTGGSGSDVIAQMACFRNLERTPAAVACHIDPVAINIAYPPLPCVEPNWTAVLYLGWNQDDWTSVATIAGTTQIGAPTSTGGADAGLVWDYALPSTPVAIATGSFVVTGSTSVISYGATVALRSADFITRTIASITPQMTAVWLKFVQAPYLNRVVELVGWDEIERTSRVGFYSVVAKRNSLAATDVHSPRTVTIRLFTQNDAETAAIDLVLSLGTVMLLHIPYVVSLKSMYAGIGTYNYIKPASLSHRATITIPLTEVDQPALSIVGNNVTWATLITNYQTWQDVLNANATWASILALTGTPADALVGVI